MTHHKEILEDFPDFVGLLMDCLRDTCAVGNITVPYSGALEQKQPSEGCMVHQ